jgi:trans-aconitate 2-methyltransferase
LIETDTNDWDPGAYQRFRGLRLQPALDLLARVPDLPSGDVVDLGCGAGDAAAALAKLGRPLIGVDRSKAMLAEARKLTIYDRFEEADIGGWAPAGPPALIFSNAALHWLDDHEVLLPRLAQALACGGTLAVQMPHQNNAPSHRLWPSLAAEFWGDEYAGLFPPGAHEPAVYHRLLRGQGDLTLWETSYFQTLPVSGTGHPVRLFTEASYARPLLQRLDPARRERLISAYEAAIDKTYPRAADGTVLFPFRRLFFTLTRGDG